MLLNQMQNTPMNDNIMAAKTLNTPQGNVNMNNMNNNKKNSMNFNSPSFNYEKNKNMITIVFNIDNKIKCNISALPNHKLGTLADRFGIDYSGAHRALRDCEITYDVYNNIKKIKLYIYTKMINIIIKNK